MRHVIIAERTDGPPLVLTIASDLTVEGLEQAIRSSVQAFLDSDPGAGTAMSATSGQFNWGDLALWVPERCQKDHGYLIEDASVAGLTVQHDDSLLPDA